MALYNGNEYLEGMLGAFGARLAPFNVNYRYVGEELRYLLNDARPRALILHASLAPTLAEVLPTLDAPPEVLLQVADESGNDLLPGAVDYEEALASASPAGAPVDPSPDDLYILYTGGTTGMPKGVLWRQHDIFMGAMGGRSLGSWESVTSYDGIIERLEAASPLRLLLLPPLMHGAAQWAVFGTMAQGSTIILPDNPRRLDPDDVWRTVEREKANVTTVVGDAVLRPLVMQLDKAQYDLSSLFAVGNGGAPLSPAVRELALARLPTLYISDAVGSSETGAQMTGSREGPAGTFVPGPDTVVIDAGLTRVLQPGHEGDGWLAQSGYVPLGYLGDAEKTARTFPTIDGVRYSIPGDRARHLADGEILLLGRDSVTVNSGGEKIFAEEVERAIAGHPAVADVVVAGRPSERWGQEVVAVVQLADGAETTADSITTHASDFIARYKLPKDVIFVKEIQRSPSGKADYRWAAEQAEKAERAERAERAGDRVGASLHLHGPASPPALHPGRPGAVRRPQHPSARRRMGGPPDPGRERCPGRDDQRRDRARGVGLLGRRGRGGIPSSAWSGCIGSTLPSLSPLRWRSVGASIRRTGAMGTPPRRRRRRCSMVLPAGSKRSSPSPPSATFARKRSCATSAWCATRRRTSITLRCPSTALCGPTCCTGLDPVALRQRARKVATCRHLLPRLTTSIPMRSFLTTVPAVTGPPVHGTPPITTPNGECRCTTTAPTSSSSSSKGPRPG